MADAKISALAALTTPADADLLPIVDVSAGSTKRVTVAVLAAAVAPGATRVLDLGPDGGHVDCGRFWPKGEDFTTDLGAFLWDAWVVHRGGEYLISDGYGGAHALLWGFSGGGGAVTGNVYNGSGNVSFAGVYIPGPAEWIHAAVGWNGSTRIGVFIDGIPDGIAPFAGPRRAVAWGVGGGGHLYVGGSDHSNGDYLLASLRGFEGICPHQLLHYPFIPERFPARITSTDSVPCAYYADFPSDAGGNVVRDSSPRGYDTLADGLPVLHHGRLTNQTENGLGDAYSPSQSSRTQPAWVAAADCPLGRVLGTSPAPTEVVPSPATPPAGCLVYDSFGRANQTLAFQAAPTLGSTEAGSRGPLAWQYGRLGGQAVFGHFGILGGRAACTADGTVLAWVATGTATHDVRAARSMAARHCGEVGVCFRVVDASNFWVAYYSSDDFFATHGLTRNSGIVYYLKVTAGTVGAATGVAVATDAWTHLRAKCVGDQITIYRGDGAASWTQLAQFTDAAHDTGQGAGITNLNTYVNTVNALARWGDFAVLTAS